MIHLRKYEEDDFEDYFSLVREDDVMRYITGKGMSEKEARHKFKSILSIDAADPELGYFQVWDEQGTLIGDSKLVEYKYDSTLLEIGYLLKKSCWGRGLGTEICRTLLALASRIDPAQDVIGIIDPRNQASRRILEKSGFTSYFTGMEDGLLTEKLILKRRS